MILDVVANIFASNKLNVKLSNETAKVLATGQLNVGNNTNRMSAIGALIKHNFLMSDYDSNSFVDNLLIFDMSVTPYHICNFVKKKLRNTIWLYRCTMLSKKKKGVTSAFVNRLVIGVFIHVPLSV